MRAIFSTGMTHKHCSLSCPVTSPRWTAEICLATLWVVNQGCSQLLRRPVVGHACLRGLQDTLSILRETYGSDPSIAAPLQEVRHLVQKPRTAIS